MSGAFPPIHANYAGASIVPLTNTRPRSASVVSLVSHVEYIPKEIRTMLSAMSVASKNERPKITALLRELIAIRHLFAANIGEKGDRRLIFDWKKPIGNIRFTHVGMTRLLREISPRIAADKDRVAFIKNYVNNADVCKNIEKGLKDSFLTLDMASKPPCKLPRKQVLSFLRNCYWEVLDLTGADLRNSYLRGVQWPGATLCGTVLIGSNLRHSNLKRAVAEEAVMDHADLGHANISELKGRGISLIRAKLYGADAHDAVFAAGCLEYAEGLRFDQGAIFTDARLTDVTAGWDFNDNPLLSDEPQTVAHKLRSLQSIPSSHDGLHNEIVWKLLGKIDRKTFKVSEHPVVTDILLKQVRCWSHKDIESFINNVMLPEIFTLWNEESADDSALMGYIMHYLNVRRPALDWVRFCGAVSQMQLDANRQQRKEEGEVLCAMVKAHLAIVPLAAEMAQQSEMAPFGVCGIFMSEDLREAMVYSLSHLAAMKAGTGSPYGGGGHYFVRTATGAFTRDVLRDLDTIKRCKVPLKPYQIHPEAPAGAKELLSYLFDGSDFKDRFIRGLTQKTLPPVTADDACMEKFLATDMLMEQHLRKFTTMRGEPYVSPHHCERLHEIFTASIESVPALKGNGSKDKDASIARMLFCLGTLFVRYSALFGTEKESPSSLTKFARACLSTSFSYDASLLGKKMTAAIDHMLEGEAGRSLQYGDDMTNALLKSIATTIKDRNDTPLLICFRAIYPQSGI